MGKFFNSVAVLAVIGLLVALPRGATAEINLLSNDRLIEAVKANDIKGAEEMLVRKHDVDVRDENRRTALFFAAIQGNEDFVELLLRFNPKIGAIDKFGSSPLYYAAAANHVGVIEMLAEKNANLNQQNRQGLTPLMVAASEGHLGAVQILIELKADSAITDFTGRTAYDWAVRNKRRFVVRYLKSVGLGS
ncbi:unnamed protein product [Discosporangium mesarthrocarpum]